MSQIDMGGSCSINRRSSWHNKRHRNLIESSEDDERLRRSGGKRPVRHSVVAELPDRTIASLYPMADNYTIGPENLRNPKTLVQLCVETVCRSLPDMDGELPPGLPQDIVELIVKSLVKKSALNGTTLRALKNCELAELSLSGCRGVRDEWLEKLCEEGGNSNYVNNGGSGNDQHSEMEHEVYEDSQSMMKYYNPDSNSDYPQYQSSSATAAIAATNPQRPSIDSSSSSCSTSSFHSASSSPFCHSDHPAYDTYHDPHSSNHTSQYNSQHQQHPQLLSITSSLTVLDLRGSQRLTDRGLLQLSSSPLPFLKVLKLDNCYNIQGRGLLAFGQSELLHTVSLANCRRLTDEALVNLSELANIRALNLEGCRCLSMISLSVISNCFTRVEFLDLTQCDWITDEGTDKLQYLRSLKELSLGWCRRITDVGVEKICCGEGRERNLVVLRLARVGVTDIGIKFVGRLRCLEELDLNGCVGITGRVLGEEVLEKLGSLRCLDVSYCPGILHQSWQGKIPSLQSLYLNFSSVQDRQLCRFSSLPNLTELNLDSCPVGDWAIGHLASHNVLPNLTSLDLADADLSDRGMARLPTFSKLTHLSLFYCNIGNAGLAFLKQLPELQVLNLDSREIDDRGLAHLGNLKKLRRLDIFSGRITDVGCAHLSKIMTLESLELCGGGVRDLGCTHLARLENLTSLNLSQNERITNRGAAALAALKNLRALNLSNTNVTPDALRYFGGLVNLQSLALYGCRGVNYNESGIVNLQGELPNLKCLRLNRSEGEEEVVDIDEEEDDSSDSSDSDDNEELGDVEEGGNLGQLSVFQNALRQANMVAVARQVNIAADARLWDTNHDEDIGENNDSNISNEDDDYQQQDLEDLDDEVYDHHDQDHDTIRMEDYSYNENIEEDEQENMDVVSGQDDH